jgi:transcriptional regulator with XRE-family HTH domain
VETLASLIGTHSVGLTQWEIGKQTPRFASFIDWAEALGYRVVLQQYG